MAFSTSVHLPNSPYRYHIDKRIKKYTLRDTTFTQNKVGNYELQRLLEEVPNSGQGFLVKIAVKEDLSTFRLTITDASGLHQVNIFQDKVSPIYREKFFFLMDSLVDRNVFSKEEV